MQTSGRVHLTSLFYTRVSTLHFAVIVYSLIPLYIHHGWSQKFQNTMVIIGEGFTKFCQLIWKITEQYRRLDEMCNNCQQTTQRESMRVAHTRERNRK